MKVYKECCKNCLLSADAIVSPERRREILKDCAEKQTHFICHKTTIEGKDVCCKTYYDKFGHKSQMIRIAERLRVIEMVDQPDNKELTPHRKFAS